MEAVNRICSNLFKMSVGQIEIKNIIAAMYDIDPNTLERLHGECVREAQRTNGNFSLGDAIDWQKGKR